MAETATGVGRFKANYAVERKIEPFYKGGKAQTSLSPAGPDWPAPLLRLWHQSQHSGSGFGDRAAESGAGGPGEHHCL
ncbi:TBL3 isoform 2 [Pongo abelii]|uniref:TBL3 isoform 2 n=1 Tax=Pongo abelii TaxID=9601 RepID=A0A2J8QZL3_PONAB|nr:TBL3 isoform 2 [Pongo abelii]